MKYFSQLITSSVPFSNRLIKSLMQFLIGSLPVITLGNRMLVKGFKLVL